ncbi:MAG: hypothetical protein HOV68_08750, partial [Streptomycetaceae bacterium]|nr:hypothetical protein [Streptomycetaceae bacterium]
GTVETRALRREQAAATAAILAAVGGDDVAAVVRRELEAAATRERAERAVERAQLLETIAPELVATIRDALADGVDDDALVAAVVTGLRAVLGGLDDAEQTQG